MPGAKKYWDEKIGNRKVAIEEWLSKAILEKWEKPVIKTLRDERKPISPAVMNEILRAPLWQISDARIHGAGRTVVGALGGTKTGPNL